MGRGGQQSQPGSRSTSMQQTMGNSTKKGREETSCAIHTAVSSLRENVTASTPLLRAVETFTASCWASGRLML